MECTDKECWINKSCEEVLEYLESEQQLVKININLKDETGKTFECSVDHRTLFIDSSEIYYGIN